MSLPTESAPEELTRERDLRELYRTTAKLPVSRLNSHLKLWMAGVLTMYAVGSFGTLESLRTVAEMVRGWADAGLGFASQIVGFVLAGFTIFATMNAKEFTLALARKREPTTDESFLKYIYLAFVRVFALYLAFILLCLAVRLLGPPGGFVSFLLKLFPDTVQWWAKNLLARVALIALGSLFWFVVVDLVGFVFNVYHTVMSTVRWEYERQIEEERRKAAEDENVIIGVRAPPEFSSPPDPIAPASLPREQSRSGGFRRLWGALVGRR